MKKTLCLLLMMFLMSTKMVDAVDARNLRVEFSPSPVNLVANPGEKISTKIRIKNLGDQTETLKISLMKFEADGDRGKPKLLVRQAGDDYFDWVSFEKNTIEISSGETEELLMMINIPDKAKLGYYYAIVFDRDKKIHDPEVTILNSMAELVLLEVKSKEMITDLSINDFVTDKKIYNKLPIKFSVKIKNKGNIHASVYGNIFIDSMIKRDEIVLNINSEKGNVLPDSNRTFVSEIMDNNKIRFGKYTANLMLIYNDGNKNIPMEAKVSFWVIPWQIVLVPIVGVLLYVVLKRLKKSQRKKKK